MTRGLPVGAERKRPVKSCVGCRTAKAACAGFSDQELHSIPDEETTDAVVLIGRRCNRCQRIGLVTCEFMPSRRKGRPRRLLPKTEDSETATASPDFTAATNSDSASPAESSRCNSSPQDLSIPLPRDTTHDSLAQAYLTQIHPFLPLLPSSSLEETSAYFARAGPHLHRSIHLLLKPRSMTFDQLPPLSIYQDTLDDLQAAVFSAFLAYGALGAKEVAKGRLRWACEKVKQSGWTGEEGDEGDGGSFQRLAWVCWGAEIQLGVLTGSRDRILGFVQPPATFTTADSLHHQALALLYVATEPSSLDCPEAFTRAQSLINTAYTIYTQALTFYKTSHSEAAFLAGMMASASTIFLLSSSSIFSTFAAPAFACGIDSTSIPPPSSHALIIAASQQMLGLVRDSLDPAFPPPVHSPFFGCGLLIAVRGSLIGSEGIEGAELGVKKEIKLVEEVLTGEAVKWEESNLLLNEVGILKRTLLVGS